MRIPSNLNRPTLYGAKRYGPAEDGSARKLLRLVLALALVVVVMRQAARVEWYEPFFSEPPAGASSPRGASWPDSGRSPPGDAGEVSDDAGTAGGRGAVGPGPAGDAPGPAGDSLADVADGSVWRGSDFPAFYHLLAAAAERAGRPHDPSPPGPLVGVLPLLQQPDIYRGRGVSVRGRVARATRREAAANEHGLRHYWELWLRPHDGSDRPLLAIVPEARGDAEGEHGVGFDPRQLASRASLSDGPWVSVDGWFLKRLAYRSAAGVELTPVVIGRIVAADRPSAIAGDGPAGPRDPGGSRADESPPSPPGRLGAIAAGVLGAILIGVGLGWLAVWRGAADTARLRRLRAGELARSARWIESADPSASGADGSPRRDPSQGGV